MLLYSFVLIAVSVVLSTIINLLIMRKTTELAVKEIDKIEKRCWRLIKKATEK